MSPRMFFTSAAAAGVTYTDYHYYTELAVDATYTPPAKTIAFVVGNNMFWYNGFQIEFYDGASWVSAHTDSTKFDYDRTVIQDSDQNIRIKNSAASAYKISVTGVTWS